jgi:hypothetical protein
LYSARCALTIEVTASAVNPLDSPMQPTVSRKIAKHVLIGTSSYPLFSICNPIAERQLSVADYYQPDEGY